MVHLYVGWWFIYKSLLSCFIILQYSPTHSQVSYFVYTGCASIQSPPPPPALVAKCLFIVSVIKLLSTLHRVWIIPSNFHHILQEGIYISIKWRFYTECPIIKLWYFLCAIFNYMNIPVIYFASVYLFVVGTAIYIFISKIRLSIVILLQERIG
jgi:hypothetical protein